MVPLIEGFDKLLHGGDYNADQWWAQHPEVITEDFQLMPLAGCNAFSIGIFAWSSLEPQEGVYDFRWLDDIMDRLAQGGHKALLATPGAGKPNWLAAKYPEVRRVLPNGEREPQAKRANHCPSSPIFRQKLAAISEALAQRYANHPALGLWHIDNEIGGEAPDCHCDLCYTNFRKWLKDKYQNLATLNQKWWSMFWSHTYGDWDEIHPNDAANEGLQLDWKRFTTEQRLKGMRSQIAAVRQFSDKPTTTNLMGAHQPLDYRRLAEEVDIVSNDSYPEWNGQPDQWKTAAWLSFCGDLMRSLSKGKPWLQMEAAPSPTNWQPYHRVKRPGVHRREMFQAIAHGAEGTLYFHWRKSRGGGEKFHGAVVDHDSGSHTRVFQDVATWGDDLKKLTPLIGSRTPVQVAMVYDWEVRWASGITCGPGGSVGSPEHTFIAEQDQGHWAAVLRYYRALWRNSVSTDVICLNDDLSQYKVLILPHTFMISEDQAAAIERFAAKGGTVLGTAMSGLVDETMLVHRGGFPGAGLHRLFGLVAEEVDTLRPEDSQHLTFASDNPLGLSESVQAGPYCHLMRPHPGGDAEVIASYGEQFYADSAALTRRQHGQGAAWWLACDCDEDGTEAIISALLNEQQIPRVIPKPSTGIHATERIAEDGTRYLCIANHLDTPAVCDLPSGDFVDLLGNNETTHSERLHLQGNGIHILYNVS